MDLAPTLLCLSLVAATMVDDQPYCTVRYRRLCMGKGRHVACQFPYSGPGESCENYTQIQFSEDMQNFVTHYINRRRQRLAAGNERVRGGVRLPKPALMMQVEWDRELATLAQRLADQCNFVHDDCRATVRYPYAGQTVGEVKWRSSESEQITAQRAIRRVLDAWWGERRRVTPQELTAPFRITSKGTVWGHFSQLAVSSLRAVGCGAVRHGDSYPRLLLVCDYSHTNMLGQRTISPGPLTACPTHTVRRPRSPYPLLCTTVHHSPYPDENKYQIQDYNEYDYDEDTITESKTSSTLLSTRTTSPTTEEFSSSTSTRTTKRVTVTLPTMTTAVPTLPPVTEVETEAEIIDHRSPTPEESPATEMTEEATLEEATGVTPIPTYIVAVSDENVVRKDEQADPLMERAEVQQYQSSLENKIRHELEGHNMGLSPRFHSRIPDKYHIGRHNVPASVYFQGDQGKSSPDDSIIHIRKSHTKLPQRGKILTAPSIVQNKELNANARQIKYSHNPTGLRKDSYSFAQKTQEEERKGILKDYDQRNETYKDTTQIKEIFKDYDQRNEIYKVTTQRIEIFKDYNRRNEIYKDTTQRKEIFKDNDQRNGIYKDTTQRKDIFKDYDQRNEIYKDTTQRKEIFKDYDQRTEIYKDNTQRRYIYESPVIKTEAPNTLVERRQPYVPSLRRKDPYEEFIDFQKKKAEEKYSNYRPIQRFDQLAQRKRIQASSRRKDISLPRKGIMSAPRKHISSIPRKDLYETSQRKDMSVPRKEVHPSIQRIGFRQKNLEKLEKKDQPNQDAENFELDKGNYELPVQRKYVFEPVRQKWKQTRRRPIRPGAHAIRLSMLASNANRPPERDASVLKMDQDDAEQLIKDTGFNPFSSIKKS